MSRTSFRGLRLVLMWISRFMTMFAKLTGAPGTTGEAAVTALVLRGQSIVRGLCGRKTLVETSAKCLLHETSKQFTETGKGILWMFLYKCNNRFLGSNRYYWAFANDIKATMLACTFKVPTLVERLINKNYFGYKQLSLNLGIRGLNGPEFPSMPIKQWLQWDRNAFTVIILAYPTLFVTIEGNSGSVYG